MEALESYESYNDLDFDNLLRFLALTLDVTWDALAASFKRAQQDGGRFARPILFNAKNRRWSFTTERDSDDYISIISNDGKKYRVGTTIVRQLDNTTQQMVEVVVPIITEHPDITGPKFSKTASQPDSFEPFAGIHPADRGS